MKTISTAEVENPLPEPLGYPSYPLLGAWIDDGDADRRIVHVGLWIKPIRVAAWRFHSLTLREQLQDVYAVYFGTAVQVCARVDKKTSRRLESTRSDGAERLRARFAHDRRIGFMSGEIGGEPRSLALMPL